MEINEQLPLYAVVGFMLLFGLAELFTGLYGRLKRRRDDWLIDIISIGQFTMLINPGIVLAVAFIGSMVLPDYHGALTGLPFWAAFLLVALPDDFLHYSYHRAAHEWPRLWPWHRTHHTSPTYNVSIIFRENWLWLTFQPGAWWGAFMVYLGLGEAFLLNAAIVGAHNVWLHNGLDFDQKLYRLPVIGRLYHWSEYLINSPGLHRGHHGLGEAFLLNAAIVGAHNVWLHNGLDFDQKLYRLPVIGRLYHWSEYLINSPGLHRGHHGLGEGGVPFGNYGQLLSVWDVLLRTVEFHKDKRPAYYGTIKEDLDSWQSQLWWPFVKSDRPGSDIGTAEAKMMEAPLTTAADRIS